jgi:hypothetical protein
VAVEDLVDLGESDEHGNMDFFFKRVGISQRRILTYR